MARIKNLLVKLLAMFLLSIFVAIILKSAKGYFENARKSFLKKEIANCVRELSYDNIIQNIDTSECFLNIEREKIVLFYDKNLNVVYSKKKIFSFSFGRSIECTVYNSHIICKFMKN